MDEAQFIFGMNLYLKVPFEECLKNTGGEPIGTKWPDSSKGDKAKPSYRSSSKPAELVGRIVSTFVGWTFCACHFQKRELFVWSLWLPWNFELPVAGTFGDGVGVEVCFLA